jgi:hypothetical protein
VLAIERKERHVLEYRQECDELWLLLVVDGSTPSSNFLSVLGVREHRFQSSFDDLFLFDAFCSQVVALRKTEAHE